MRLLRESHACDSKPARVLLAAASFLAVTAAHAGDSAVYLPNLQPVQEPSALALLAAGLLALLSRVGHGRAAARVRRV